jgi:hypothetical protein
MPPDDEEAPLDVAVEAAVPLPAEPCAKVLDDGYKPETDVWVRRLLCVSASITSTSVTVAALANISLGADLIS